MWLCNRFVIFGFIFVLSACAGKSATTLGRSKTVTDLTLCNSYLQKKKTEKAITCFESYKSSNFNAEVAVAADLQIAQAHFLAKEFLVASELYQQFVTQHPNHPQTDTAMYQAGLSFEKSAPKILGRDITKLESATLYYKNTYILYPASPMAGLAREGYERTQKRLAQFQWRVAKFYLREKEFLSALPRLQTILTNYPSTGYDEPALAGMIVAFKALAQPEMVARYRELLKAHFPQSKFIKI